MDFEWDPVKATRTSTSTESPFAEAATSFGDPLAITFNDPEHCVDEDRDLTFGHSVGGDLLVVSHTDRDDRTRIISARQAGRKERRIHEQG